MKPIFSVHAGESLAGSQIERQFKQLNVWVPSRDRGIDLLVSDSQNERTLSFQVKFGKDWLVTHVRPEFQPALRACGWWTVDPDKLRRSPADFWVFVSFGFVGRTKDFVVVPTRELQRRLAAIHGGDKMMYLWVTSREKCWETRGLRHAEQLQIADGRYENRMRDFSKWLNRWPLARLNV